MSVIGRRLLSSQIAATTVTCDKIVCLGKNYTEHAKELGDAVPQNPVIFNKPSSVALRASGEKVLDVARVLPYDRGTIHYEAEIVMRIGVAGSIKSVSVGLDLTLRNIQSQLKKNGHPWEVGKVFPGAAILGPWIRIEDFPDWLDTKFIFSLDRSVRQTALGKEMRMQPEAAIQYIQSHFSLLENDIVFLGTPKGVGPLVPGQLGRLEWGDKLVFEVQF